MNRTTRLVLALTLAAAAGLASGFGPPPPPQAHNGLFIDGATLMGGCSGAACVTATQAYYQSIGVLDASNNPTAARGTLAAWKASHGFATNPQHPAADEQHAIYYNNADLGFGRDMHCRRHKGHALNSSVQGEWFACYVTNFSDTGAAGGDPQNSMTAAEQDSGPIATVAMDMFWAHHPSGGPDLVAYVAYDATGAPLLAATLDSEGPKPVPGVCVSCHGGTYDSAANLYLGGNFVPFDTPLFLYDTVHPAFSEARTGAVLRTLNSFVKASRPTQPRIVELIDGWYAWCGGVQEESCRIDDSPAHRFVPPAWANLPSAQFPNSAFTGTGTSFYVTAVRPYCRNCHVALADRFDAQNPYCWSGVANNGSNMPCNLTSSMGPPFQMPSELVIPSAPGKKPYMPYAERTYGYFWADPAAVKIFSKFGPASFYP